MEDKKQSYFGEVGSALKTLATGLKGDDEGVFHS